MNGGLTRLLTLLDEAFAAEAVGDENTADLLFAEVARVAREVAATQFDGARQGRMHDAR